MCHTSSSTRYLTMLLDTGTLHCDPHPGNLLRTRDGKLCILDFGMCLDVPTDLQLALLEFIANLQAEAYERVPEDLVKLGFVPPDKLDDLRASGLTYAYRAANHTREPHTRRRRDSSVPSDTERFLMRSMRASSLGTASRTRSGSRRRAAGPRVPSSCNCAGHGRPLRRVVTDAPTDVRSFRHADRAPDDAPVDTAHGPTNRAPDRLPESPADRSPNAAVSLSLSLTFSLSPNSSRGAMERLVAENKAKYRAADGSELPTKERQKRFREDWQNEMAKDALARGGAAGAAGAAPEMAAPMSTTGDLTAQIDKLQQENSDVFAIPEVGSPARARAHNRVATTSLARHPGLSARAHRASVPRAEEEESDSARSPRGRRSVDRSGPRSTTCDLRHAVLRVYVARVRDARGHRAERGRRLRDPRRGVHARISL